VSGGTAGAPWAAARWLLLDVGGVLELVDDAAWPGHFRARWAERLGMTTDDFSARLVAADLPDASRRTGVVDRYWGGIGTALGLSVDQLAAMRADFWDAYCGTLNEPLYDFLAGLRGTIGLAILSNSGDGAREEEERRFRFSAVFDPICYSHEIGVNKPDPEAWRTALRQMGASPDEVFFVDDVPENIEAARALGIRAHLHVDTDETIRVLRAVVQGSGSA
jgi:putative hydrolase of the HAD superfamily